MGTLGYKNRDAQCGSQASNSCRKKNKNLPFFVHSHDRTYLYRCHGHLLDFGLERRPNQSESVAHRRCLHHERHILHHLRHRQEGCCSVSATESMSTRGVANIRWPYQIRIHLLWWCWYLDRCANFPELYGYQFRRQREACRFDCYHQRVR
jgi:hypothetical protein